MLVVILLLPLLGGLLAWVAGRWGERPPRWIALATMVADLALVMWVWYHYSGQVEIAGRGPWFLEFDVPWIPQFGGVSGDGIRFSLAMDGLSLLMVALTAFLGLMSVAASWTGIKQEVGFFHFNLLAVLTGIIGVFLAMDLFLFYIFWEVLLVPLYFLIGIWGYSNRIYAALKFFIFTQASGLLMLVAILGLYFLHGQATDGYYTFNYHKLLGTPMSPEMARWLMLCLFAAFAVKLPVVPLHTWLPDAHTQAPTAGSVDLAGLVLKVGAYGLIRLALPLFPQASLEFAPVAQTLAVIGIIYGAVLAFAQTDVKRLVAYTSISHMGFVLLGIYSWNTLALEGAVMVMVAHGLSTGALFIIVGALYERIHTRDMDRMGGLWSTAPRLGGAALFFAVASLGLPGLAGFVGEFLILLGTWPVSQTLTIIAAAGLVLAAVYALTLIQRTFLGRSRESWKIADFGGRETAMMAIMIALMIFFGLYPQPLLRTARPALEAVMALTVPKPATPAMAPATAATAPAAPAPPTAPTPTPPSPGGSP